MGYEVILGDTKKNLQMYANRIIDADRTVITDFKDEQNLREVTRALQEEAPLDAIFTFKEFGLINTSKLLDEYHLLGNRTEVIESCNNKFTTRNLLRDAGLPSPDYMLCKNLEDAKNLWEKTGGPIILKPHNLQGSIGVFKVERKEDLPNIYITCLTHCREPLVMAEHFIDGQEVSIEAIVYRGKVTVFGVTEKLLYPNTFVEAGHTSPFEGGGMTREEYKQLVEQIVKAMKIQIGPLHIEGFHTEKGFYVGEVHTRYGGDNITTLTELALKCDMTSPIFAELGDIPFEIEFGQPQEVAAIRFLHVPPGKVESIEIGQITDIPGIVDYEITCKLGDEIAPITSNFDRVGWVLAKAASREKTEEIIEKALKQVKIRTV
ncbi:ATP-grasp domain-containing protein [Paenibacillus alvei]|uniref:ATP-grasp domain-containing protein n=1 Tax=Paenibacillus alvei TaxID=44250 RepID=A0AAP7DKI1_PAEAL|nr:ATP-grasp domain-containing protein [Paenibacillus alvei]NOJ73792.1 ATP-grasp domain-containing protein [Paenibacillus alvei]